ncbi:MAG: acetylglutamate kinase [Gemmataceae bacterium]
MEQAIRKADVLIEALHYIRQFRNRVTVIKLGGSVLEDADTLRDMLLDVVFMETVGMRPVLVHGAGKAIDRAMAQAGLPVRKTRGRRYTDAPTLAIVSDVLQQTAAHLERTIHELGGRAVRLHGGSLQALYGQRSFVRDEQGMAVDLGFVGEVTRVDRDVIERFCHAGVIPVVPSLALDPQGQWLNVNADTAAAAIAAALQAEKLVFVTDTPGILRDVHDPESLIPTLDSEQCRQLVQAGVIASGMIPKIEACLESLQAGVRKIHIIDGRVKHSLLLEIYTDRGVGTEIVSSAGVQARGH